MQHPPAGGHAAAGDGDEDGDGDGDGDGDADGDGGVVERRNTVRLFRFPDKFRAFAYRLHLGLTDVQFSLGLRSVLRDRLNCEGEDSSKSPARHRPAGDGKRLAHHPRVRRQPVHTKTLTDRLQDRHGIYRQPINYPTVARGTERLRITPGPCHTAAMVDSFVDALGTEWSALGLARTRQAIVA